MKIILGTLTTVFFAFGAAMVATSAVASENAAISSAVVGKSSCGKLANTTQPFILVLNSGDGLLESITQCAKDAKLKGASISGLGQVHNPTLAYFTSNPDDKPTLTTFSGYYELASFNGNITNNANKYYTHAHAVLADKQFHGIAGHVNAAKVGLTAEITIKPFLAFVQRTVDPKTGFGPIVQ
jgi:predicted DNA-binding protein with PD1-like motif